MSAVLVGGSWSALLQVSDQASVPTLRVDVEFTTVDVVVLDRQGKPLDGLKQENFRLFEDGREQRIVTFDKVWESPDVRPSEARRSVAHDQNRRGKVVLILFDSSAGLSVEQSSLIRQEAEKYVQRHMRPFDWMGVAVLQRTLRIVQELTHDRDKVVAAIRQMNATSASGAPVSVVDAASVNESRSHAKEVFGHLSSLISSLEPVQGRKAILLFTTDFDAPASSQGEFQNVVARSRDANLSFFTLDAAGRYSSAALRDRSPFGSTAPGSVDPNTDFVRTDLQTMTSRILRSLADDTGGNPIYRVDDLAGALDDVDLELSNYYVLGYQSDHPARERQLRKIEVRADVEDARLKYRGSHRQAQSGDRLAGSSGEKPLLTALASPVPVGELPVSFRAVYFHESAAAVRVPVFARVEAGAIKLRKRGSVFNNSVRVVGAAYDADGREAARFSDELPITLNEAGAEDFRKQDVLYSNSLRLRPGRYKLRLAVADEGGKRGTAEQSLTIPPLPAGGWAMSSLVISQDLRPLPALIRNVQAQLIDNANPLLFRGYRIYAPVDIEILRQRPSLVFYRLYNFGEADVALSPSAVLTLKGQNGETHRFPPIDLKDLSVVAREGEIAVGFRLPTGDLPPGKYQVTVETTVDPSAPPLSSTLDLILR